MPRSSGLTGVRPDWPGLTVISTQVPIASDSMLLCLMVWFLKITSLGKIQRQTFWDSSQTMLVKAVLVHWWALQETIKWNASFLSSCYNICIILRIIAYCTSPTFSHMTWRVTCKLWSMKMLQPHFKILTFQKDFCSSAFKIGSIFFWKIPKILSMFTLKEDQDRKLQI